MVGIEEVATRNELVLYRTTRPGQYKAHCPVCQDRRRTYHLYVSADKDTFFCHKCGAQGGVIAFHAWLRDISWEAAKTELYPSQTRSVRRTPVHPAERLTREQLTKIGMTLRTPSWNAPTGVDRTMWAKRRKAELDWIWNEWCAYERATKHLEQALRRQLAEQA
ncbi:MAG: CHC2 zinc finger domain-containing protein [Bacilli bacterium]